MPLDIPNLFGLVEAKRMLVYFTMGVVCFDYKHIISFERYKLTSIISFCILYMVGNIFTNGGILTTLIPYAGIYMILQLSYFMESRTNGKMFICVMQVSVMSYTIYLFHTTFEGLAKSVVHKIPVMNEDNQVAFIVGALFVIVCGIVMPILIHKYILTKYRITRFLFGMT